MTEYMCSRLAPVVKEGEATHCKLLALTLTLTLTLLHPHQAISLGLEQLFAELPADGRLSVRGGGVCGGPLKPPKGSKGGCPIQGAATAGQARC